MRVNRRVLTILLASLWLVGCASIGTPTTAANDWQGLQPGVHYAKRAPLPDSVVHVVRVDLQLNRLEVSGIGEKGKTIDTMAGSAHAAMSANASFFDKSFQPRGITISQGQTWAPVLAQQTSPLLACDALSRCLIQIHGPFEPVDGWYNAVAGTPWLLEGGKRRTVEDDAQCKSLCENAHPRTAVGLDGSQRYLYIVTAEGRKPPVMGLSLVQLSAIMADLGVVDAINLDGGGSSALLIQGQSVMQRPANEPGQRKVVNAIHIVARLPK